MFRMEFQSHVTEEVDDDTNYSVTETVYQPAIFEGWVGHFGKVHRVSQSNLNENSREAELMDSRGYSPVCKGLTQDEISQQAIFPDAQVLQELVRPFAALQHGSVINVRGEDESSSSSSMSCGLSMRSECSSFRSDISSPSEGSVADLKALQREGKPWDDPFLAMQQQNEIATEETRRRDEEQRFEAITTQRELLDLANCVDLFSPSHGSFKKNKLQKVLNKTGVTAVCRFFKNPFGLFKSPKIHNGHGAREGVHSLMMPRRVVNEYYPSSSDAAAALQMQTPSSRRPARSVINFATVNSTQRDVPAWTMEEYMRRNGKMHQWKRRKDDEECGGIEGNNLMNQNFDDGWHAAYDSDSD